MGDRLGTPDAVGITFSSVGISRVVLILILFLLVSNANYTAKLGQSYILYMLLGIIKSSLQFCQMPVTTMTHQSASHHQRGPKNDITSTLNVHHRV